MIVHFDCWLPSRPFAVPTIKRTKLRFFVKIFGDIKIGLKLSQKSVCRLSFFLCPQDELGKKYQFLIDFHTQSSRVCLEQNKCNDARIFFIRRHLCSKYIFAVVTSFKFFWSSPAPRRPFAPENIKTARPACEAAGLDYDIGHCDE